MTDLIEKIGPIVGVVAFLGLAILAFLIFQQAREVRRLREWAGRAPERAVEAADATAAAAEARGEAPPVADAGEPERALAGPQTRFGEWWARTRERLTPAYDELDRRSPVDPRYLLVVIAAAIVAAGVLTSGFGVLGDDDGGGAGGGKGSGREQRGEKPAKAEVAVLNATQELDVNNELIPGVAGLANTVANDVVKPAGFPVGTKADAPSGFDTSTIYYEPGDEDAANELAQAVAPDLGETDVEPIIDEIKAAAGGANVVLVVGRDDAAAFGQPGG
jgi:hypothetical protein